MNTRKTLYSSAARSLGLLTLALAVLATSEPANAMIRQDFPWDWEIVIRPNIGTPTQPIFGEPIPIPLWGNATVDFHAPTDGQGNTFDLGPSASGLGTPIPAPVPPGAIWTIDTEIVALSLTSMMPIHFPQQGTSFVELRLGTVAPSLGRISNLQNIGGGQAIADSFFDIFVEIDLPQLGMTLRNVQPMTAGMSFGTGGPMDMGPVGDTDVRWIPTWIWQEGFGRDLLTDPGELWDQWISVHGHPTPEPGSLVLAAMGGLALAAVGWRRRRSLGR